MQNTGLLILVLAVLALMCEGLVASQMLLR